VQGPLGTSQQLLWRSRCSLGGGSANQADINYQLADWLFRANNRTVRAIGACRPISLKRIIKRCCGDRRANRRSGSLTESDRAYYANVDTVD
jgi:hypothetical protein